MCRGVIRTSHGLQPPLQKMERKGRGKFAVCDLVVFLALRNARSDCVWDELYEAPRAKSFPKKKKTYFYSYFSTKKNAFCRAQQSLRQKPKL